MLTLKVGNVTEQTKFTKWGQDAVLLLLGISYSLQFVLFSQCASTSDMQTKIILNTVVSSQFRYTRGVGSSNQIASIHASLCFPLFWEGQIKSVYSFHTPVAVSLTYADCQIFINVDKKQGYV